MHLAPGGLLAAPFSEPSYAAEKVRLWCEERSFYTALLAVQRKGGTLNTRKSAQLSRQLKNKKNTHKIGVLMMVPGEGVEPSHPLGRQILSLLRLPFRHPGLDGAGEGNRTLVASLEGWSSAIELRPQKRGRILTFLL